MSVHNLSSRSTDRNADHGSTGSPLVVWLCRLLLVALGVVGAGIGLAPSASAEAPAQRDQHASVAAPTDARPTAQLPTSAPTSASPARPSPRGVEDCIRAVLRTNGIGAAIVASARCGWGVGQWYANTSYYKNNWNRIINGCWPNCSNWQIIRAWLGLR
jgi:hypothetical protein